MHAEFRYYLDPERYFLERLDSYSLQELEPQKRQIKAKAVSSCKEKMLVKEEYVKGFHSIIGNFKNLHLNAADPQIF